MYRSRRVGRVASLGISGLATIFALFAPAFLRRAAAAAGPPPAFVHNRSELAAQFPDSNIDAPVGGCLVVTPKPFVGPSPATDPNYGWQFSRVAYLYAPRHVEGGSGLFKVVTIHYEPEQREQARHSAALMGRLWSEFRDRVGNDPAFPQQAETANVYLATQTPPGAADVGGRTRNDDVYIFGVGVQERTPIEWVRTVAHEWGHLTLSAARGYHDPEEDAAGYLGERLYLKWLHADEPHRPTGSADDGTTEANLSLYYHRQIAPLMARFETDGPGSKELDGTSTAAMDYYIGSVLAVDEAFGSHIAGRALYTVLDDKARSFLVALRTELAETPSFAVLGPAWVPLLEGDYRLGIGTMAQTGTEPILHVEHTIWRHLTGGSLRFTRVGSAP